MARTREKRHIDHTHRAIVNSSKQLIQGSTLKPAELHKTVFRVKACSLLQSYAQVVIINEKHSFCNFDC